MTQFLPQLVLATKFFIHSDVVTLRKAFFSATYNAIAGAERCY